MKKRHNAVTEHYLIPAVLFLLNVCLGHLVYALAAGSAYSLSGKIALAAAFVLMGGSLLRKKQAQLAASIVFYAIVVLWV